MRLQLSLKLPSFNTHTCQLKLSGTLSCYKKSKSLARSGDLDRCSERLWRSALAYDLSIHNTKDGIYPPTIVKALWRWGYHCIVLWRAHSWNSWKEVSGWGALLKLCFSVSDLLQSMCRFLEALLLFCKFRNSVKPRASNQLLLFFPP